MTVENIEKLLLDLAPTGFLLHFSTEKSWATIQHKGLVPQPQESTRIKWVQEDYGIHLPNRVIWFGREPAEVFANKETHPIVIGLPINYKKFELQETIPNAEYIAEKHILPDDFLGFFDFTQYQEGSQEEKAFISWLEKMEKKTNDLTQ